MAPPTRRVDLWFTGIAQENRLTVAFRIILAIPQFIVLWVLGIATFFVAIIGWFAALVTGRLPPWAHTFMSGVVRWYVRVGAYVFLLTDRYPPFSLEDEDYPVRPIIPAPGELNRVAVLFRIILVIPAAVYYTIVELGLTYPLLFVAWLIALVNGELPQALFWPYSALLRFQARTHSYFLMLTSEYAWGMLGDQQGAGAPSPAPPPPLSPSAWSTGATGEGPAPGFEPGPADVSPAGAEPSGAAPLERQPADAGQEGGAGPAPPPMPPPTQWERSVPPADRGPRSGWGTIVLLGAARGWMIFAIVWGAILFVLENARIR